MESRGGYGVIREMLENEKILDFLQKAKLD